MADLSCLVASLVAVMMLSKGDGCWVDRSTCRCLKAEAQDS